jgi:hypothetical protein
MIRSLNCVASIIPQPGRGRSLTGGGPRGEREPSGARSGPTRACESRRVARAALHQV